ncbi:MAG: FlgD immunoglobulin-like domain containing protein [Candidatus Latescibacterota bacterium]
MRFSLYAAVAALTLAVMPAAAQFSVGGDARVNPEDFAVTVFADDLNYPVGMVELPDGSLLVAVTVGGPFFSNSNAQILRLVDADGDGVAESRTILFDGLTISGPSALRMAGDLLFVSGQRTPIAILRLGEAPDFELREVGRLSISYTDSWLHPQSALQARKAPGSADTYELYFPLGSRANFAKTTATLRLTGLGLDVRLAGDAIHRVRFRDDGERLTGIDHTQIATGLRSASGLTFHPDTGDLYFEDNGIDGLVDAIEAHSADEINVIPLEQIGGEIEDFGFPGNYIAYRTGEFVGGEGIAALFAFTPLPEPGNGSESEGPNEITFAPPGFPPGLNHGLFVGFHGQFSRGGLSNEENPLVYADPNTGEYFHFVSNEEPGVGHLDGLLATGNKLYAADISSQGGFGNSSVNSGFIYLIRYTGDPPTAVLETAGDTPADFELGAAYPNPFNPSSTIRFSIPAAGQGLAATLKIYDVTGQLVETLLDATVRAGHYRADWNGRDSNGRPAASGSYFFKLRVGDVFVGTRQAVLLK